MNVSVSFDVRAFLSVRKSNSLEEAGNKSTETTLIMYGTMRAAI